MEFISTCSQLTAIIVRTIIVLNTYFRKKALAHKFIPNTKGPTEDRRDDLRF